MRNPARSGESGNAFFIVMISVVLFVALMYTFSRGMRQGGDTLTGKQAGLAASDIIDYAQKTERAVSRVYSHDFSENAISFQNDFLSGFENADCGAGQKRCRIFMAEGGGIAYRPLGEDWSLSQTDWIFSGTNQVLGIGRDCTNSACSELLMLLEDVPLSLCTAINAQLDLTDGAPPTDAHIDTTLFAGTFSYAAGNDLGDEDAALNGVRSGCFQDTGSGDYYFYHVLLER